MVLVDAAKLKALPAGGTMVVFFRPIESADVPVYCGKPGIPVPDCGSVLTADETLVTFCCSCCCCLLFLLFFVFPDADVELLDASPPLRDDDIDRIPCVFFAAAVCKL